MTLRFLESHLVMIPLAPRLPGCDVVAGKDITPVKVKALADAADACWEAIMSRNLKSFAQAFRDSFDAQVAMFPGMIRPHIQGVQLPEASVVPYIEKYSVYPDVLAWKLTGAGGGGYLALVVNDSKQFIEHQPEAILLRIRRV